MANGTLYTYPENFRAFKAQIAAQYSGAQLSVKSSAPDFEFGTTNKTDAFLKKFPLGKVPAFESKSGVTLFESNAIAFYLANEALRGKTVEDQACIQQWMNFADNELLPAACTWVFPCMGIMQYNKQNTERAKEDVKRAMDVLDKYLLTRTFLVGERISLADICVACNLLMLYQWVMDPSFRAPYTNANRWFFTMVNQKQFKAVVGDFKAAETMAQFDSKKFNDLNKGAQGGKKDKPKQDKPKQEKAKPKEQPKKAEAEADEPPKEKPSKDPFGALPGGKFVMDEWKKMFSNNDISVALPWFHENFEPEFYSVWTCEYLFPEELGMAFMSQNLIGGMFQRLDRLRKHGFGSMCLFKEGSKSMIRGLWFWRGQDLAFTLSEDLQIDYESYKWTKLDYNAESTKDEIKQFFSWENFTGKDLPFDSGKIFK